MWGCTGTNASPGMTKQLQSGPCTQYGCLFKISNVWIPACQQICIYFADKCIQRPLIQRGSALIYALSAFLCQGTNNQMHRQIVLLLSTYKKYIVFSKFYSENQIEENIFSGK